MIDYKSLPIGKNVPKEVNAVIEVPKGERNKYEYDPELGIFKLDRVLYASVHYPTAYGFIPNTLAEDGDPLDVMVMTHGATFTGCLIEVRPVGLLKMRDDKGMDDKVLSVPVNDPIYNNVRKLADLPPHLPSEIEHFFTVYKQLENKQVESFGWHDFFVAERAILSAMERLKDIKDKATKSQNGKASKTAKPKSVKKASA
ncbi:MAG: inorganic diphosphatase [Chlorobiales bacterium]